LFIEKSNGRAMMTVIPGQRHGRAAVQEKAGIGRQIRKRWAGKEQGIEENGGIVEPKKTRPAKWLFPNRFPDK